MTDLIDQHPSHKVIIVTHGLMTNGSSIYQFWQVLYEIVKYRPNVILMLCGHVPGERSMSNTFEGHTIHTLLADYQSYEP